MKIVGPVVLEVQSWIREITPRCFQKTLLVLIFPCTALAGIGLFSSQNYTDTLSDLFECSLYQIGMFTENIFGNASYFPPNIWSLPRELPLHTSTKFIPTNIFQPPFCSLRIRNFMNSTSLHSLEKKSSINKAERYGGNFLFHIYQSLAFKGSLARFHTPFHISFAYLYLTEMSETTKPYFLSQTTHLAP